MFIWLIFHKPFTVKVSFLCPSIQLNMSELGYQSQFSDSSVCARYYFPFLSVHLTSATDHLRGSSPLLQAPGQSLLFLSLWAALLRRLQAHQEATLLLVQVGHLSAHRLAHLEHVLRGRHEAVAHGLAADETERGWSSSTLLDLCSTAYLDLSFPKHSDFAFLGIGC